MESYNPIDAETPPHSVSAGSAVRVAGSPIPNHDGQRGATRTLISH